ncbi:hypothetical protein C8J56DRAFT_481979 [Mycena floridula]|nr:hypothetical protein C8J56DRAFT_481979 [Mycena floridula]
MQPPSEIPDDSARIVTKQWLEPFVEIWSDNTLCTSDLDTIKESTALDYSFPEFHKREIDSLSWTLQHTTNDGELVLFLEGIPVYLNSPRSDLHFGKPPPNPWEEDQSPAQALRAVLQHPESTFLSKLKTFISTRYASMNERDASAVVNALSSLFEKNVNPYTEATRFLHDFSPSSFLQWFMKHTIELHPSLSPAIHRLNVRAVLRCAEARGLKYTTAYHDLFCWPYRSIRVPVESFRYSELRSFWDTIASFLGFKWVFDGAVTSPTAGKAANATETNQGMALLSLCVFFWQAVPDPQGHFTVTFHNVILELISYVSPLAEGSAEAQQAYSAAVWLLTSALEEAPQWPVMSKDAVSKLLDPLVKITDDAAATTAQRVLCSPLWFTRLPDNLPSSWPANPKVNQTVCAQKLIESLGWHYPGIPENITTLAGLPSTIQIQLTRPLKRWLTNIPPNDLRHLPSLFRLLGTLDEPKAVIEVQLALREFLTTPEPERNPNTAGVDVTQMINVNARPDGFLSLLSTKWQPLKSNLDAREALRQLEMTARKPEFIYKALSIPDYP